MAARRIYDNPHEKLFFVRLVGLTWFLVRSALSEVHISKTYIKDTLKKEQQAIENYVSENLDELNALAQLSDE